MKHEGFDLERAPSSLRDEIGIVLECVGKKEMALAFASDTLRGNRQVLFMTAIVANSPHASQFVQSAGKRAHPDRAQGVLVPEETRSLV